MTSDSMSRADRVFLESAFLLHRRSYRETSLLVDFLTRNHGRVTLLAKGARRNRRLSSALLFPFVEVSVSWSGRGELPILTDVEVAGGAALTEPKDMACALYLNELSMHLLAPHDPHPEVFQLYRQALEKLSERSRHEPLLRHFEVSLLEALGYGLPLERDINTGFQLEPGRYYRYVAEHGVMEVPERTDSIRGSALIALRTGVFEDDSDLRDAKRLMRKVIASHLGGRTLRSRELFIGPRI